MADKRISQLNAVTTPTGSDLLVIVNNNETKKITYANLVASITGSETDLSALNTFTQSIDGRVDSLESWSSSLDSTFATDLQVSIVSSSVAATIGVISQNTGLLSTSSFNTFTQSIDSRIDSLENTTSSYETKGSGILSGSVSYLDLTNIPSGIVSQSTDLSSLNAFTASYFTDSASVDSRLDGLESWSSSLGNTFATDLEVSIVSSSVAATIGIISQNIGLVSTSSFNSFTQSIDSRVDSLENKTGSFATTGSNLFVGDQTMSGSIIPAVSGAYDLGSVNNPWRHIYVNTGSIFLVKDAQIVKVLNTSTIVTTTDIASGSVNITPSLPSGVISGSVQLTSSFDTRYTLSGSVQPLPNGLISGSTQLTSSYDSKYTLSSSYSADSSSFNSRFNGLLTTGSNTFSGSQVFSGSMTVTSGQVIASTITNNSSSLFLQSGSNLYVQNDGVVEITGSIVLNGTTYTSLTGSGTIPAGTISGSSQLTSSFDERYTLSGSVTAVPSGTISGSSQLTSSFDTRYLNAGGDGVWSGSAQVTGNLAVTSVSASVFVGGYLVPEAKFTVLSSKPMTFWPNISYELVRMTTGGGVLIGRNGETNDYGNRLDVSGSVRFTGNTTITGSLIGTQGITGSISATNGVISGSSQLTSSFDTIYAPSASYLTSLNGAISSSTQVLGGSGIYSSSAQLPSGLISGSSQLTSSYDTRYTLSGSVVSGTTPAGTISGSSQLTSSFDGRYTQTGSFNTLTASFNSFTASGQAVTTGSNSFNGTQTITGSLNITNGSIIASQITANTASLYLTSGSNLYVQNNGVVEITGSLNVSGSATLNVPVLYVGTGSGDEGGEINLAIPVTNTALQNRVSVDVWRDRLRLFEGSVDAKGVYIDLSKAPAGVGGELTWKASGLVNRGTDVTLGNLKVRFASTGNMSLQVSTVTGTYSVYGSGIYTQLGSTIGTTIDGAAPKAISTTPTYLASGYNFGTAGATDTWVIMDTSNTIAWRITMIVGAGFSNNFISIERLH